MTFLRRSGEWGVLSSESPIRPPTAKTGASPGIHLSHSGFDGAWDVSFLYPSVHAEWR